MFDKYALTVDENIHVLKKLLSEGQLLTPMDAPEGTYDVLLVDCNLEFFSDKIINDNMKSSGFFLIDRQLVINYKNAWRDILNTINDNITVDYWIEINALILYKVSGPLEPAGIIRYTDIDIGNINYKPKIPKRECFESSLSRILTTNKTITEKAIELYLYGCKTQNFYNANKRTSFLIANKLLVQNGTGVMANSFDDVGNDKFKKLLKDYYETGNDIKIKNYIYKSYITIG